MACVYSELMADCRAMIIPVHPFYLQLGRPDILHPLAALEMGKASCSPAKELAKL